MKIQKYFLELQRWRSYWNRMCLYLRRGRFEVRGGDAGNTVAVWILAVYNKHRLKTLLLISKLLCFVHSYITTYPKGQLTTLQGSLGRHSYLWVFGWTSREPLYLNTARAVSWTTGFERKKRKEIYRRLIQERQTKCLAVLKLIFYPFAIGIFYALRAHPVVANVFRRQDDEIYSLPTMYDDGFSAGHNHVITVDRDDLNIMLV